MKMQTDTFSMLAESGWSIQRLAKEAGVNASALSRFLNKKRDTSIHARLLPFIYGEKRPLSNSRQKRVGRVPDYTDSAPHAD